MDALETSRGPVKRFSRSADIEPPAPPAIKQSTVVQTDLPAWLRAPAPPEKPPGVPLRPSDPADNEADGHAVVSNESRAARERAMKRGTLTHRLLQSLPDVAPERRIDAARSYLERNAKPLFSEAERDAMAQQVIALIATPGFTKLFATGSRAEVSIAGRIPRRGRSPLLVSGQIDRLVVTKDEVLIVDYKTNHAPPQKATDAPPPYVRQLSLYRDVLQRLYPGRPVRCALLWTETAAWMEIPASALDAELQSTIS
jgi:ATP-dependent helicase/nuclease subunit A